MILRASLPLLLLLPAAACAPAGDASKRPTGDATRVAVLAPAAAEMLEGLGLGERVVAVGEAGRWPESMRELPSVGRFDAPNAERLVDLRVDRLVTSSSVAGRESLGRVEDLGVEVLALDTSTLEGVFVSLERLGAAFGCEARAARIAEELRRELRAVEDAHAHGERPTTLIVVGRDPLFVAGPGSHLHELVERVGGVNVVDGPGAPYRQYSLEEALARSPQVILDMTGDASFWSSHSFLPAVRDRRVHPIDADVVAVPGPRLAEMARYLAARIHAEPAG